MKKRIPILKPITENAALLIGMRDPLKDIENAIKNLKDSEKISQTRYFYLKRHRLSLFLSRELKNETKDKEEIISTKLNNEILRNQYTYNEEGTNCYLHKKTQNYYSIIHFRKVNPAYDIKKAMQERNLFVDNYIKKLTPEPPSFLKVLGAKESGEYMEERKVNIYQ
jgi:hypothetical protein